jgi:hypothetical protein
MVWVLNRCIEKRVSWLLMPCLQPSNEGDD